MNRHLLNMLERPRKQNWGRFTAGLFDSLAFLPSVGLLGVIFGASARAAQISPGLAIAMSMLVWSGSGQFAALAVWQTNGLVTVLVAIATRRMFLAVAAGLAEVLGLAWLGK